MADYAFYAGVYQGTSMPLEESFRLLSGAQAVLDRYKRIYTVTSPNEESEDMAVCAIADALYYFETVQNMPQSASIGSVSSSQGNADTSPKAQAAELYRCACLYLDIYRGCG